MWWCACKAATRRGTSSGYSWPHVGPVVEGRCFSQVSINWRDVTRHIGFIGPGLLPPPYTYIHIHSLNTGALCVEAEFHAAVSSWAYLTSCCL